MGEYEAACVADMIRHTPKPFQGRNENYSVVGGRYPIMENVIDTQCKFGRGIFFKYTGSDPGHSPPLTFRGNGWRRKYLYTAATECCICRPMVG